MQSHSNFMWTDKNGPKHLTNVTERPRVCRRSGGFQDVNGFLERRSEQSAGGGVVGEGVASTAVIRSTETCREDWLHFFVLQGYV